MDLRNAVCMLRNLEIKRAGMATSPAAWSVIGWMRADILNLYYNELMKLTCGTPSAQGLGLYTYARSNLFQTGSIYA